MGIKKLIDWQLRYNKSLVEILFSSHNNSMIFSIIIGFLVWVVGIFRKEVMLIAMGWFFGLAVFLLFRHVILFPEWKILLKQMREEI